MTETTRFAQPGTCGCGGGCGCGCGGGCGCGDSAGTLSTEDQITELEQLRRPLEGRLAELRG